MYDQVQQVVQDHLDNPTQTEQSQDKEIKESYVHVQLKFSTSKIQYDDSFRQKDKLCQTQCCICMEPFDKDRKDDQIDSSQPKTQKIL